MYIHVCMYIYIYSYSYIYIYIYVYVVLSKEERNDEVITTVVRLEIIGSDGARRLGPFRSAYPPCFGIVAIFYPFSQFCEIGVSLLSLQNSQKRPPRYFRGGWNMARGFG